MPLDVIAARAGVGAGTVHRHFPTKEQLIAAVVADRLAGLADRAMQLGDSTQPVEGFFAFLHELTAEARKNAALTGALGGTGIGEEGAAASRSLSLALGHLLERAQQAGGVRSGLTVSDLHAVLGGVFAMERSLDIKHRGIGLDIVIAGLRSSKAK